MKTGARSILLLGGALLLLYPFWGLLYPLSYVTELSEHYAFAEGVSPGQVRASAAMLWISNGVIAFAFFSLARYISFPSRARYVRFAAAGLILYPFCRTLVEVWSGINLTSHATGVEVSVNISSEKLFFIVFGLALLGISSAWAELNNSRKPAPVGPLEL